MSWDAANTAVLAEGRRVLIADPAHAVLEATWGIYQRIAAAYRDEDPAHDKRKLAAVIEPVATGVPAALFELVTLGHTLKRRAGDILARLTSPAALTAPPKRSTAASNT